MTTTTNTTKSLTKTHATICAALMASKNRDALVDYMATLADRGDIAGCEMVAAALAALG
jgi:hypothetical protein